jgi:hypothetical protein
MKVFILGRPQRFTTEVIDDEKPQFGELIKSSFIRLGSPGGVEPRKHGALGGEGDVLALSYGAMPEGLIDVALAGSTGSSDKNRDLSSMKLQVARYMIRARLMEGLKEKSKCLMGF